MLDPKLLRNDLEAVAKKLSLRQFTLNLDLLRQQEKRRKKLQVQTENLQAERNARTKNIRAAKSRGDDIELLRKKMSSLDKQLSIVKTELEALQHDIHHYALFLPNITADEVLQHDTTTLSIVKTELEALQHDIHHYALFLPNITADEVPTGFSENDNVELLRWGKPRQYDFPIRDHVELGEITGEMDFAAAVKLTGARFVVMRGHIALLHRALIQFMLDLHIEQHGYQEYYLPCLVNQTSLYGTGQLPKFSDDLFHTKPIRKELETSAYALIPTAEVPLTNLMRNEIIPESMLPIKMLSHTLCFRSEAGSYGRDTRGLIRMHQFEKVELVQIVEPETSMQALEELTFHAEKVLQLLKLPYRKMLLCTGDIGFTSCKTYDLEVWLPAQNNYREISSCSNISDFQARRMHIRYKKKIDNKIYLAHTLNGSGLAIGRTLVAVLENYQQADGRIKIPVALQPYMKGLDYIG